MELKDERTSHINRLKGLLVGLGLVLSVDLRLPERLDGLRNGTARQFRRSCGRASCVSSRVSVGRYPDPIARGGAAASRAG